MSNSRVFLTTVLVLGIILRIALAFRGHNFDVDSYWLVANIVAKGANIYAETERYNYGPIWSYFLYAFYLFSQNFDNSFFVFRLLLTIFLTGVDLGIAIFIYKRFGQFAAILFFLNPISIVISGFHSQFDNFAILLGLVGAYYFDKRSGKLSWISLLLVGISITLKHLLFIFPIWLAIKQKGLLNKLLCLIIPLGIFLMSFAPFWEHGQMGIISNVLLYRSFPNQPFWFFIAPEFFRFVPVMLLFVTILVLFGFITRKKNVVESLLIYLLALVLFAPAIANQYLAIVVPTISVYPNLGYLMFTLFATVHLFIDPVELNIEAIGKITHHRPFGYIVLILLLSLGFALQMAGGQMRGYFERLVIWIKAEIKAQKELLSEGN